MQQGVQVAAIYCGRRADPQALAETLRGATALRVHRFGSLSATGTGHGPERATLAYSEHMLVPSLMGAPLIWARTPPRPHKERASA